MTPLLSVIVPTYNRSENLPVLVRSIQQQSFKEWELLIVDDGSTDNTKEQVASLLEDKRIKYFFKTNSGVSDTRNVGASHALAPYLYFIDSDDLLMQETFSKLHEAIAKENPDILFTSCKMVKDGREKIKRPSDLGKAFHHVKGLFLAGTFCIKRELFHRESGFNPSLVFGENFEFGFRVCQQPIKYSVIDHISISYFIDSQKRTSNSIANKLASNLFMLDRHLTLLNQDKTFLSTLLSQTGYLYKAMGNRASAAEFYCKSFRANPFNYPNIYRWLSNFLSA